MDRNALWQSGQDETVEVNQRALIDKILARYSGEHTIFRELLQNADDAGAHHVQVKFYTKSGVDKLDKSGGPSSESSTTLPDVKKELFHRYVVTNDGIPFRPEDWSRLKKIAEGNPDESKIGAFGVGFYSLWSVSDDPFVESGSKWMGFYWKEGKDQLMARSGDLPASDPSSSTTTTLSGHPRTSFSMNLREPSVLEGPLDLARFLVTSLSFTRTIRKIDMLVDDITVLEVEKSVKGKERVVRRGLKETSTGGMMKVRSVDATGMIITAKVTKWLAASGFTPPPLPLPIPDLVKPTKAFASFLTSSFFGRSTPQPSSPAPPPPPPPPDEPDTSVTTLNREIQVYQAEIGVSVTAAYARELERATKKPPPKVMPASLVYSLGDTSNNSSSDAGAKVTGDIGGVFAGLCPPLDGDKAARIFIGQATSQTTGIGGHLAARFIPTVERESVDLVDKHVAIWNKELLWVGGHISRLVYELELQRLQTEWSNTSVADTVARDRITAQASHALRFFTFKPTTPSATVGQEMESAFYQSAIDNKAFLLVSTGGILPIKDIRLPNAELATFVPGLAVVPASLLSEASRSVARLKERGMLRDLTFDDVIEELGKRALSEKEMIAALSWWESIGGGGGANQMAIRSRFMDAAILVTDAGKIIPLSLIQTVVRPSTSSIPPDMPLPSHTLPYNITKDLRAGTIHGMFGWTELNLVQYVTFLISPPMSNASGAETDTDIRVSPIFAERVLTLLGRAWQSMSTNHQSAIALELKDVACIPTKAGFKKPGEAYFEKNLLFDDLPTIALPKTAGIKGGLEKMLLSIGVRRTVDLQLVFSRLIGGGTWTCQDLMKYLVSVKDTLSTDEIARLKQTTAFPLELRSDEITDGSAAKQVRKKPRELYEPVPAMRELGLPILDWGEGKWRANSDEAKMLFMLGLRRFPPIDVLLGIASSGPPLSGKALQYLLANMSTQYSDFDPRTGFANVAFIPATRGDGKMFLAKPGEAFTNWACSILGFAIADPSIVTPEVAAKLRLPSDPPMDALIAALTSKVTIDTSKAQTMFGYLATRLGYGSQSALDRLQNLAFIPVKTEKDIKVYRPNEVYFSARDGQDNLYKSAFTFIDFGEQANVFLKACGVKSEPSVKDIARLLMREPERMLRQAGSPDRYLEQLRLLAANWTFFDNVTKIAMKNAAFVLGSQRIPIKRGGEKRLFSTGQEDDFEREWVLCRPSEVAVVDDITFLQYFGANVLAAPEEQLLETFYENLGAKRLSSLVKVEYLPYHIATHPSSQSAALKKHVLERLTIFLADARRAKSDYTSESLMKDGHFQVSEARMLEARYIFRNAKAMHTHKENLYAMAQRKGRGIVLTISTTAPADDYDVAAALCSVLLKNPKADDALLLYSILSTPLMALKKRGYNVDRILNSQREEKLRMQAEASRDKEKRALEAKAAADAKSASAMGWPDTTSDRDAATQLAMPGALTLPDSPKGGGDPVTDQAGLGRRNSFTKRPKSLFDRLRGRKPSDAAVNQPLLESGQANGQSQQQANGFAGLGNGSIMGPGGGASGGASGPGSGWGMPPAGVRSTDTPTDAASIRRTVKRAIDASRPEMATRIEDSRRGATEVSESQETYCDQQAAHNLQVIGPLGGVQFWIPSDISDPVTFFKDRKMVETSEFFASAFLLPLADVFGLNAKVMNVFWDRAGPLIAFNRGGAIFCNARYFDAWHAADCRAGKTSDAFTSWYFSIAHELAHNLEEAHNAKHEFFFSSIAEEYLTKLVPLLRSAP